MCFEDSFPDQEMKRIPAVSRRERGGGCLVDD